MREKAWRVAAAALLMGFAIGVPGAEQAAADQDSALFEDGPVRRDPPLRVEWVASADRSGRPRLEGSVRNDFGRTARNVQLRISEINAAGETVSSVIGPTLESVPGQGEAHFDVPVAANRYEYRVAVASFSFDFAEPAAR
jgi:hypothetical protein